MMSRDRHIPATWPFPELPIEIKAKVGRSLPTKVRPAVVWPSVDRRKSTPDRRKE